MAKCGSCIPISLDLILLPHGFKQFQFHLFLAQYLMKYLYYYQIAYNYYYSYSLCYFHFYIFERVEQNFSFDLRLIYHTFKHIMLYIN
jgi:hypothetical protein